jgi:hypothetical protein
MYKLSRIAGHVIRIADGLDIPADPRNTDRQAFERWVVAGNTPLPADAELPAPDPSDVDSLEKALKALALCVAQVGGLTPAQMKTLFKQKWDQLS